MRKHRSTIVSFVLFLAAAAVTFVVLSAVVPTRTGESAQGPVEQRPQTPQDIKLVALGDSLTEGVGDASRRGGYVPLSADLLEDLDSFSTVQTYNAGKSGATAAQIQALIKNEETLREELTSANMIVLSAGGNNLVRTFTQTGLNAPKEAFEAPLNDYQAEFADLLEEIRQWNPDAPVYVFGIYNPYSYYFSDIEPLQQIIDAWNDSTEEVVQSFTHMYFIPIDQLINTLDNVVSGDEVEEQEDEQVEQEHPYLFQGDYFHPNEEGYRLMAEALVRRIEETWLQESLTKEEE